MDEAENPRDAGAEAARAPARYEMEGHRTFHTFAHLLLGAGSLVKSASEQQRGSGHCLVAAAVFSAFAFEAALNHIGEAKVRSWAIVEPRLTWRLKLDLIVAECRIAPAPDWGRRPFQSVAEAFKLRDLIAHGKTVSGEVEYTHEVGSGGGNYMDPPWLSKFYDLKVVARTYEDVDEAIGDVLKAAGLDPHLASTVATGSFRESRRG